MAFVTLGGSLADNLSTIKGQSAFFQPNAAEQLDKISWAEFGLKKN
jgi:hypothetical protein